MVPTAVETENKREIHVPKILTLMVDKYKRLNWDRLESQEIRGQKGPRSKGSCSYAWKENQKNLEERMKGAVSVITVAV